MTDVEDRDIEIEDKDDPKKKIVLLKEEPLELESELRFSDTMDSPPTGPIIKIEKNCFTGVDDFLHFQVVDLVNNLKTNRIWATCLEELRFQKKIKSLE